MPRTKHIMKLQNIKDKAKILRAVREEKISDFSIKIMEPRQQQNNNFKILSKSNCISLYSFSNHISDFKKKHTCI